jgi:hypothetical protein
VPATPASPSVSANENRQEDEAQPSALIKFPCGTSDRTCYDPIDLIFAEEEGNPEFEIVRIFRRKIAGLRRLPRHMRAQEIRAALEWLSATMKGLRDKRAYARHARKIMRQYPAPN